jgi:probable HAF family extracellular repeat protein
MKNLKLTLLTCLTLSLASSALAQKQHAFIWNADTGMTDLGTLGGDSSFALGVNDSGEVCGYSYLADNTTYHAFTWTAAGGMVDLGTADGHSTRAWAINSAGDLTGDSGTLLPFYWSPGGGFVLIGHSPNYNFGFGINDNSDVTGQFYDPNDRVQGFFWSPTSSLRKIGDLSGLNSVGNAINSQRHITGTANLDTDVYVAIIWARGAGLTQIAAIGGGRYTAGEAINDNDEIVGVAVSFSNQDTGFYWSRATGMTLLQTLGGSQSAGFGINQSGEFAGYTTNASGAFHATTWATNTSAPQDLGTLPGGTNSYARAINNLGQVVGFSDVP